MNTNKPLQNIRLGWSPFVVIAVTTLAAIAISIYCLSHGRVIIFQNLFYFPIIIACVYYTKKGFAFSFVLSFTYLFLVISFTRDSIVIIEALIGVFIFVGVAGVTTLLSIMRKRAEEAMRDLEVRYRRLFESTKDGILILDAETGMIVDVNPFLIALLGFSHEQFVGKAIWEIGLFKDIAANKNKFIELQRQEYVRYEDLPLETADGRRIEVEFISNIYTVDHQKVIQCNIRDITDRKQIDEKTRRMEEIKTATEIKTKFTSMVSHELRSPLGSIKEGINLVLEGLAGSINDEQRDLLDTAKRNTDRLGRLINNVLDFQKIESGKMEYDIRENDINEAVLEVNKAMSLLAKEKGLDLVVDAGDSMLKVRFDKDRIIQVLTNLVSNAIKYTEKGNITISTKGGDNKVHIIVQDTGIGIKVEDMQKLFCAFEQLDSTRDKKRNGTGLGLAISKEIILAHNGKIWAESEVGKGSGFHFILPIRERRLV
jgi:PAS domain S-box-containing protein